LVRLHKQPFELAYLFGFVFAIGRLQQPQTASTSAIIPAPL
jgi:hypothetical protein